MNPYGQHWCKFLDANLDFKKIWGKIRLMFQNNLTDSFQTSIFLSTGTIDTTKKKMLKQIKDSLFLVGIWNVNYAFFLINIDSY